MAILIKTKNLLGDCLTITPGIHVYKQMHENEEIHVLASVPDDVVTKDIPTILKHNPDINRLFYGENVMGVSYNKKFDLKAMDCFQLVFNKKMHMSEGYGRILGVNVTNPTPIIKLIEGDYELASKMLEKYQKYIVYSIHSWSSTKESEDGSGNKKWANAKWNKLVGELPYPSIIVGATNDPQISNADENLLGMPIRQIAGLIDKAHLIVGIDNGLAHIVAALKKPMCQIHPCCLCIPNSRNGSLMPCWVGYSSIDKLIANPVTLEYKPFYNFVRKKLRKMK